MSLNWDRGPVSSPTDGAPSSTHPHATLEATPNAPRSDSRNVLEQAASSGEPIVFGLTRELAARSTETLLLTITLAGLVQKFHMELRYVAGVAFW